MTETPPKASVIFGALAAFHLASRSVALQRASTTLMTIVANVAIPLLLAARVVFWAARE